MTDDSDARARHPLATVRRFPVTATVFAVELYRTYVSPTRMPTCRFTPTCSEYAVEALRTRGFVVGSLLTLVRLAKCGPWHPGGWNPVPPRRRAPERTTTEPLLTAEKQRGT
ncbi:membrane protein insertion efficiency factor YidD [Rhodococcus rhodnii]|uniref:Putative membrane protein insertion efficiency factor n=2 Tax=Rhodococcus rhodnii TaxID=38312 RepID=R7WK26_9NOCA|nr:membrane protein insertion efficiency factor YidD [Rhodococcus rhodnii]EOM75676.1 hypothetical protein Rrhod_2946 [Rhodococcus rhodnii LMG 5362]TXG89674.1 membrane protein insertion efficiency factor YidD [Rhodococcus rhodnii]